MKTNIMFQRRHYEVIAAAIKEAAEEHPSTAEVEALHTLERRLCTVFARDNPAFNVSQFADACKPSWQKEQD